MTIAIHEEGSKDFSGDVNDTWDNIQTTAPNSTDGVFQVTIGMSGMQAGDTWEGRIQMKDAASGTLRTITQVARTGAQTESVQVIFTAANDWNFDMRQRAGTGRTFAWSIVKVT
jgi:hypothetical protein